MVAIAQKQFGGVAPAISAKALPDHMAQLADNCSFFSGSLKPIVAYGGTIADLSVEDPFGAFTSLYKWRSSEAPSEGAWWLGNQAPLVYASGMLVWEAAAAPSRLYYTNITDQISPTDLNVEALYVSTLDNIIDPTPPTGYNAGVPAPSVPPFLQVNGAAPDPDDNALLESRVYVATYVNGWFEESAPSPPSEVVTLDPQTQTVIGTLATDNFVDHDSQPRTVRFYRAVYGGVYQFVAEFPLGDTFQLEDNVSADNLGEALASTTWTPPPGDVNDPLFGLTALPNGMMAAATKKFVWFCEPYRPFAWPLQYAVSLDYTAVALASINTTLVVLTTGTPYLLQGTHPADMVSVKVPLEQACIAPRSVVSYGGKVMYASPDGLVTVSSAGAKVVTEERFDRDSWQTFIGMEGGSNVDLVAAQHDQMYFLFNKIGGLIYHFATGDISYHYFGARDVFQDLYRDALYLLVTKDCAGNDSGDTRVVRWGQGDAEVYKWRSKRFTFPQPVGLSCGNIDAGYTDGRGVTITLYANSDHSPQKHGVMTQVFQTTVYDMSMFRLPPVQARDWEFQLEADIEVFAVTLAQSPSELASV